MVAKRSGRSTAAAAAPRRGPGLDADFRQITQADIIELPIESVVPGEHKIGRARPIPSQRQAAELAKLLRPRGARRARAGRGRWALLNAQTPSSCGLPRRILHFAKMLRDQALPRPLQ